MKKVILASFAIFSLSVISCENKKEQVKNEQEVVDSTMIKLETGNEPINYEGKYKGTIPCFEKDCKDVEMEVELLPHQGYVYSTKRVGVDKEFLKTTGVFEYEKDGNTIVLPEIANVPNGFSIEKGKIVQLNKNRKKVETADSAKFVLLKQ